jgi:hypothetical protein
MAGSGGLTAAPDELRQRRDRRLTGDAQTAAEITSERHAMLCAGLGRPEEGIPAIASAIAAGPGADLAADHLTTDVVLRAVGVKRYLRPVQHHQQFGLVGMQSLQQPIQRDEAGAAAEDAIEPGAQRQTAVLAGVGPVNLEIGVEVPD